MKGLTITKRYDFGASHRLTGMVDASCNQIHDHHYSMELTFVARAGHPLPNGIIVDTAIINSAAAKVIAIVDHKCLNDIEDSSEAGQILREQPSLENFTLWFWSRLQFLRCQELWKLTRIKLAETEKFSCEYSGE